MIHIRFSCVPSEMLARERRKVKRKMQFSCLLLSIPFSPTTKKRGKEVMETREVIVVQERETEREMFNPTDNIIPNPLKTLPKGNFKV